MSLEILEKVKDFLIKFVKDESFRTQLMSHEVEAARKAMADSGYNFSQDEFETAALKILDLKESGEFHELTEEELVGAVGGLSYAWPPQEYPKELPEPKPYPCPKPIDPQPMYGVIIKPIDPIVQPMYGVIVEENF